MRRVKCIVLLVALLAVAPVLSGCGSLDNFDTDSLDIFGLNKKKKLPGERKELFPEGVPGVSQGIPPEYLKGNQPPPETALAPAAEPAPAKPDGKAAAASKTANLAPAEEPKPKPKRKPKPRAVEHAPTQITVQPKAKSDQSGDQQQQMAPWPNTPPAQGQGQSSSTAPWPASPAPGTFSR